MLYFYDTQVVKLTSFDFIKMIGGQDLLLMKGNGTSWTRGHSKKTGKKLMFKRHQKTRNYGYLEWIK